MIKRIGVYAGSFDPIHCGHLDIINRACDLFDEIHIVVAISPTKSGMFLPARRKEMIETAIGFVHEQGKLLGFTKIDPKKIVVSIHQGLLVQYVDAIHESYKDAEKELKTDPVEIVAKLIRGIRPGDDIAELQMAMYNNDMGVDTVLLPASRDFIHLSSSGIKEVARYDINEIIEQDWVVEPTQQAILRKLQSMS